MGIIKCCKDCIPPKRHPACHDTCKEYKEEKEQYEKEKAYNKKNTHQITNYELDYNTGYHGRRSNGKRAPNRN